jgi:2,3-bisphosphoglycerate-dependent phosphoglycerate mutase
MPPRSMPTSVTTRAPAALPAPAATWWLVRHGESSWNTLGLAQGHNDEARLTHRGLRQAAAAAERFRGFPVRALYSSDLRRALQTAAAFSEVLGLPVLADPRLRERSLGILEGTPAAGNGPSVTGLDLTAGRLVDPDARPAGGESVRDLYRRAAAFCDGLAAGVLPVLDPAGPDASRAAGAAGDVVIVAHGGTLRVLRAYLNGVPVEDMRWEPLENTAVLRIPDPGTKSQGGI